MPPDTQAVLLLASDVTLDLSSFHIIGPYSCSIGGCQVGSRRIPASRQGWVRTGESSATNFASSPGRSNCNAWTSKDLNHYGTTVSLGTNASGTPVFPLTDWTDPVLGPTQPWIGGAVQCSLSRGIWCVEDR